MPFWVSVNVEYDLRRDDRVREVNSVEEQNARRKKQGKEELVVPIANAVIHPHAVMIRSCDASVTEGAMLAPCWLGKTACAAYLTSGVEDVIVGVAVEMEGEVLSVDGTVGI